VTQPARNKGGQHIFNFAAGLRYDLDTSIGKRKLQRPRDGAADQHVHAQLGHVFRTGLQAVGRHRDHTPLSDLAVFDVHDYQLGRHVEHGGNSALPIWNCCFHRHGYFKNRAKPERGHEAL